MASKLKPKHAKKTPLPAKRRTKEKKELKYKVAASFIIHDADLMTPEGRSRVEDWMRQQADFLRDHGDELARRYRARYLYPVDGEVEEGGGEDGGLHDGNEPGVPETVGDELQPDERKKSIDNQPLD